jgi:transposase
MSLQPTLNYSVPEQTARIAKAAFPKGILCLQIYDHLGTLFQDQDFVELFPGRGQPATAPFRLALVTLLQYVEGLSDRAAANAVRSRLDWKYLLCLELEDSGFDFSVLSEFRDRLLAGDIEYRLLEKLLEILRTHRLVKARVRVRTDSTQVLAAVREVNRLERIVETLRAALNALATVVPAWVQQTIPVDWVERYGARAEDARLPQEDTQRTAYAERVGQDGYTVLQALWSDRAPGWLRQIPAVEILRQVWVQNFHPLEEGGCRWRTSGNLPPAARSLNSPYDPKARYSKKRDTTWLGYKVHLTESCEEELPHLITHIQTTAATTGDNDALPAIHQSLERTGLLPDIHLVDTGYMEAKRVLESRDAYGIDLFGPIPGNHRWQFQQGVGFDLSSFQVDWQAQSVTCPKGKRSSRLQPAVDRRGNDVLRAVFKRDDCSHCDSLRQCTSAAGRRRTLTLKPQPLYEVLAAARQRQLTDAFKAQYKTRAGIEGSISQGVRAFGLRRCRYQGEAKTRLQHVAIAAAMNLVRLGAWFAGSKPGKTRKSVFARLMAPRVACA